MQLTRSGITATATELENLKHKFAQHPLITLPNFLDQDLKNLTIKLLEKAVFFDYLHDKTGHIIARDDAVAAHDPLFLMYQLLLNDNRLLKTFRTLSGCEDLAWGQFRVFRSSASSQHFDSWHQDLSGGQKQLGFAIVLSPQPFEGGVFQLARKRDRSLLGEVDQKQLGDAHLFRIHQDLEHRATAITGEHPRIVCAGWFRSDQPNTSA